MWCIAYRTVGEFGSLVRDYDVDFVVVGHDSAYRVCLA